ncbi:hypothetical protein ACIP5N_21455 [Streptomyces sp. NPDC088768]|uniref:hypothetical protein n=1 Tax=Streptomyces sp. NPDC088768 TaxID=3365894 RepID=UPI0038017667
MTPISVSTGNRLGPDVDDGLTSMCAKIPGEGRAVLVGGDGLPMANSQGWEDVADIERIAAATSSTLFSSLQLFGTPSGAGGSVSQVVIESPDTVVLLMRTAGTEENDPRLSHSILYLQIFDPAYVAVAAHQMTEHIKTLGTHLAGVNRSPGSEHTSGIAG